ncbi:hypothetical protein BCR33DRAFT_761607 [Rhizoclosmatium globosum]|uniref:RlpA-like protein double-psi beta-barrel domain-containing protein n=1 Tax=Rhizoclosmatium globosum TaxID=329046 RepID=A0A1Y2CZW1_9FUNG|nr:hypothetical protein BCR33DRAFT_761607 [Rhizoclosmatium globosum]|eukprot:ORY52404.1 hypothetical protein BCR33DRAFT_761607 [Rhizoclosmatium globosum]
MHHLILLLLLPLLGLAQHSGVITWYETDWSQIVTACTAANPPGNNLYFAAVSVYSLSDQSSILNTDRCGKCIKLWLNGASTLVTVVDVMMRWDANPDDIDLSTAAFSDIVGDLDTGRVANVPWEWADCTTGKSARPIPVQGQALEAIPKATEPPGAAAINAPIPVPNALPAPLNGTLPALISVNGSTIAPKATSESTKKSSAVARLLESHAFALSVISSILLSAVL